MKTRRIFLQPDECVEVMNVYGTSVLKAITRFKGDTPCVVVYEQPDVLLIHSAECKSLDLTCDPYDRAPDITEQNELALAVNPIKSRF